MRPYVHLHMHSEMGLWDGFGKVEEFVEEAKRQGAPAMALTEHGSIRGWYKLQEVCADIGDVRPLYGCELYVANDMNVHDLDDESIKRVTEGVKGYRDRKEAVYQEVVRQGLRPFDHLTVMAMDQDGMRSLYRLTSLAWLEGFAFNRPRVDLPTVVKHSKGVIAMTACMDGVLARPIIQGQWAKVAERLELLRDAFGDRLYIEIMPHYVGIEEASVAANKGLIHLSRRTGVPLVATQDAHYVHKGDDVHHEVLLCIHTRNIMNNPDHWKFGHGEMWMRTRAEMEEAFRRNHPYIEDDILQPALDRTLEVAERCTAEMKIDRFKALVPPVEIPVEFRGDEVAYLSHLCKIGWKRRDIPARARERARRVGRKPEEVLEDYKKRLEYELARIGEHKFERYFLVIWDLYEWCQSVNLMTGPGRGSAAGCLVDYLLGITRVDPLEYGLLFERFLAPGRIDLPDIDCDFEDARRGEVIDYLRDKYGHDKTAQIATVGRLTGKACVKDIARVLQIPIEVVVPVTNSIIQRSSGDERASFTIEDSFREFKVCREFDQDYPQLLHHAIRLEGHARQTGIHAAGVVASPEPLMDHIPLEVRQQGKGQLPIVVAAWDMYGVQAAGLMKIDVLGLRNLSCIRSCLEMIKKRTGEDVNLDDIDREDSAVFKRFTAHEYAGVFQYDTPSCDKIAEGVKFSRFEDVVAIIALDRPGTARSGLATEYLKRKRDPKARVSIHPVVDEICADTYGVIVYQEHVIKMFTQVAGFDPKTADSLRKKIAKKWGDEAIGRERESFIAGAVSRGFSQELAEKLINQITFFGSYGFNKAHATCYGLISYWQMWLKTYYPVEFMYGLLRHEPVTINIARFVKEARRLSIRVMPADVNGSGQGWSISGESIVGSLTDLKGIGVKAMEAIMATRPFTNLVDFAERVDRRRAHRGTVSVMLRAGAMDDLVLNPRHTYENLERIWAMVGRKGWQDKMAEALLEGPRHPRWSEEERQDMTAELTPVSFGKHPLERHEKFLNGLGVKWTRMDDEGLFESNQSRFQWFNGMVVEIRYNQIGDFHSGPEPDDGEKARMGWGKRYATLNVEDVSGVNRRVKIDPDVFEVSREIIDQGKGAFLGLHAAVSGRYKSIKADVVVDLAVLRTKVEKQDGCGITFWERIFTPVWVLPTYTEEHRGSSWMRILGVVIRVYAKLDRNLREMAFVNVMDSQRVCHECVCFASSWGSYKSTIQPGVLGIWVLRKGDRGSWIMEGFAHVTAGLGESGTILKQGHKAVQV